MLFAGREVRIEKNCAWGRPYIDRGHNSFQYGPPGQQITFLFIYFIYFYWNFCRLCLSRIRYYLLAGKMVKNSAHSRNQSDYRILFILPARGPKKKIKNIFVTPWIFSLYIFYIFSEPLWSFYKKVLVAIWAQQSLLN